MRCGREVVTVTSRLSVTTWSPRDLDALHVLHADPDVMRYMASGIETREQTAARLRTFIAEQRDPGWTRWRVADAGGELVGRAGLRAAHGTGFREVGYLLAPRLWGRGHATDLVRALLAWHRAHPEPGVDRRLRAYVFPGHRASRAVLERAGFVLTGSADGRPRQLVYSSAP